MTMTEVPTSTTSSADIARSLQIIEIKPGKRFSVGLLERLLPDVETALFFGKVYDLDYRQLSNVLSTVLHTPVAEALFGEGVYHSVDLQSYLVDICDVQPGIQANTLRFDDSVPIGELLPAVWESLEVEVAASIKAVAEKLESVVDMLPGKNGEMLFKSMMTLNAKRPTLGDHKAYIHHAPQKENLLILDVSGSMNSSTISRIIGDVVALSYKANAHMAIVSNWVDYWTPGSYGVDDVLAKATYGGTHYETLAPLFDRDWGTVITIADYDSSYDAKAPVAARPGRIDMVLDISLVSRPTFLAEVVGQLAAEVRPLLVANSHNVLAG